MTTKQILFSVFFLGAISNIGLAMENNNTDPSQPKVFDRGWCTNLNTPSNLFVSMIFKDKRTPESNEINVVECHAVHNKEQNGKITIAHRYIHQGTLGTFREIYDSSLNQHEYDNSDSSKDYLQLLYNTDGERNNAIFCPKIKTIIHGTQNTLRCDEYYNKRRLLDEKTQTKKTQLRFNKKFVERYCKKDQCEILKTEIKKTEKEINQMYQNL